MDRFKFRVWNKRYSKYHYDAEMTFEENKVLGIDYFGQYLDDDDFVVEQCIGLKDKNGKLIYENDIVKDRNGHYGYIKWDNEVLRYFVHKRVGIVPCWISCPVFHLDEYEVVGNIHENSELLKDSK